MPAIHSIVVGTPVPVPDNLGDTWSLAWMPDGKIFSASNDSKGFHRIGSGNVMFSEIRGEAATGLTGETVNTMSDYRKENELGPDGAAWKSSGCISVDNELYLVVVRHTYGETSCDATRRQAARNASIIRSGNGGKTWVRSAQDNYDDPMFPGSEFATPYFISYGQDGHETHADGSDQYIYALSNNGFWDNGDAMVLGRVLRSELKLLQADKWQYLKGTDGAVDSHWTSRAADAQPVLRNPNHLGSTGAVYLPAHECYLMISWYYPPGGGKMPKAHVETVWDFYVAAHPWGPWEPVGSHKFNPEGFYCPMVCPKFTSADGSQVWAFTAGDWNDPRFYCLTAVPLTLK